MRNFQDAFETRKWLFIHASSVCMTVPLSICKYNSIPVHWIGKMSIFSMQCEVLLHVRAGTESWNGLSLSTLAQTVNIMTKIRYQSCTGTKVKVVVGRVEAKRPSLTLAHYLPVFFELKKPSSHRDWKSFVF